MGTPLGQQAPEPIPGDFKRDPRTGAPLVVDPSKTRQPTGRKADLLAKLEARGITPPAKTTVPELKKLLGAEPAAPVVFGRPSSLGKQIENTTNLQKWSERATALGVFLDPELLQVLGDLDENQRNLDDGEARELLDRIVVKAKAAAQAGIAAERGTHTHALTEDHDGERDWIERARTGEDLGIEIEAQAALVKAWERALALNELEIIATEVNGVDFHGRQAGTIDRIARLGKDLRFVLPGGEIVTLPAGLVVVLDIKTGRLREERGIVQYWQGYSVQVATYARCNPYDVDTDQAGEWGYDIDQHWALIAHLDVRGAIDGQASCRLVLVDIEAGREAAEHCLWARQWERRTDVFSLITDDDDTCVTVEVASTEDPATSVEAPEVTPSPPPSTDHASVDVEVEQPESGVDGSDMDADPALHIARDIGTWSRDFLTELKTLWPAGVPTPAKVRKREATWTPEQVAVVRDLVRQVFPPFVPVDPDRFKVTPATEPEQVDGGPLDPAALKTLLATIKASPVRDVVNAWLHESQDADCSWHPAKRHTVRSFEQTRAAFALASIVDDADSPTAQLDDDTYLDVVRQILAACLDSDQAEHPTTPIGVAIAALDLDEAMQAEALARGLSEGRLALSFNDDGRPVLVEHRAA